MRTIVCRFKSRDELLAHLRQRTAAEAPSAMTFLGDFAAAERELIKLILVVEDQHKHTEQQCSARMILEPHHKRPAFMGGERLWHYTGEFVEEDRVWLKMFMSKLDTLQSFGYALAS